MTIRGYRDTDEEKLIALWRRCGLVTSLDDPGSDIRRKNIFQPGLIFVSEQAGEITGSIMAGYEGHRGWVNYLAVTPTMQRGGLGRALMEHAEKRLAQLGCPKVNLQVRGGNPAAVQFYERLGYRIEDRFSMGKQLETPGDDL